VALGVPFYEDRFGASVALSSDGNNALIGDEGERNGEGGGLAGAWMFTRSESTWTQLVGKLDCAGGGCGVALSGDASTALVGTAVYVKASQGK
jgi:hypothetical protein